jgi:hypothetical protein
VIVLLILHHLITYIPPELARPPSATSAPPAVPATAPSGGESGASVSSTETGAAGASGTVAPQPASLDQQIAAVQQAAQQPIPQAVTVTTSEADLNAYIQRRLAEKPSQDVRNARVSLGAGTLTIEAVVHWEGRWLALTATGVPTVASDGRLQLQLQSARVGRVGLPGSAMARLQGEVDHALRGGPPAEYHVRVDTVSVSSGELIVSGTTIPH